MSTNQHAIPRLASSDEKAIVRTLVGFDPDLALWVNRIQKKGNKKSPRLLVLGRYHLWYLKKTLFGSLTVCKAAHLYDLKAINFTSLQKKSKKSKKNNEHRERGRSSERGARSDSIGRGGSIGRGASIGRGITKLVKRSSNNVNIPGSNDIENGNNDEDVDDLSVVELHARKCLAEGRITLQEHDELVENDRNFRKDRVTAESTQYSIENSPPIFIQFNDFKILLENLDLGLSNLVAQHSLTQATTVGAAAVQLPPCSSLEFIHRIYSASMFLCYSFPQGAIPRLGLSSYAKYHNCKREDVMEMFIDIGEPWKLIAPSRGHCNLYEGMYTFQLPPINGTGGGFFSSTVSTNNTTTVTTANTIPSSSIMSNNSNTSSMLDTKSSYIRLTLKNHLRFALTKPDEMMLSGYNADTNYHRSQVNPQAGSFDSEKRNELEGTCVMDLTACFGGSSSFQYSTEQGTRIASLDEKIGWSASSLSSKSLMFHQKHGAEHNNTTPPPAVNEVVALSALLLHSRCFGVLISDGVSFNSASMNALWTTLAANELLQRVSLKQAGLTGKKLHSARALAPVLNPQLKHLSLARNKLASDGLNELIQALRGEEWRPKAGGHGDLENEEHEEDSEGHRRRSGDDGEEDDDEDDDEDDEDERNRYLYEDDDDDEEDNPMRVISSEDIHGKTSKHHKRKSLTRAPHVVLQSLDLEECGLRGDVGRRNPLHNKWRKQQQHLGQQSTISRSEDGRILYANGDIVSDDSKTNTSHDSSPQKTELLKPRDMLKPSFQRLRSLLATAPYRNSLMVLRLSGNSLGPHASHCIAVDFLSHAKALKALHLAHCNLDVAAIVNLGLFPSVKQSLQSLKLDMNSVTTASRLDVPTSSSFSSKQQNEDDEKEKKLKQNVISNYTILDEDEDDAHVIPKLMGIAATLHTLEISGNKMVDAAASNLGIFIALSSAGLYRFGFDSKLHVLTDPGAEIDYEDDDPLHKSEGNEDNEIRRIPTKNKKSKQRKSFSFSPTEAIIAASTIHPNHEFITKLSEALIGVCDGGCLQNVMLRHMFGTGVAGSDSHKNGFSPLGLKQLLSPILMSIGPSVPQSSQEIEEDEVTISSSSSSSSLTSPTSSLYSSSSSSLSPSSSSSSSSSSKKLKTDKLKPIVSLNKYRGLCLDLSENILGHKYGTTLAEVFTLECSQNLCRESRLSPIRQLVLDHCQLRKRELVAILESFTSRRWLGGIESVGFGGAVRTTDLSTRWFGRNSKANLGSALSNLAGPPSAQPGSSSPSPSSSGRSKSTSTRRWSTSSLYSSSLKPAVPDWAKALMPTPIGSTPLKLVKLSLRGDRSNRWLFGDCVAKVVERIAGNFTLKILDVSFNNAGDSLATALGLVLAHQGGLAGAGAAESRGLEELNWDGNNTTLAGFRKFKLGASAHQGLIDAPLPLIDMDKEVKKLPKPSSKDNAQDGAAAIEGTEVELINLFLDIRLMLAKNCERRITDDSKLQEQNKQHHNHHDNGTNDKDGNVLISTWSEDRIEYLKAMYQDLSITASSANAISYGPALAIADVGRRYYGPTPAPLKTVKTPSVNVVKSTRRDSMMLRALTSAAAAASEEIEGTDDDEHALGEGKEDEEDEENDMHLLPPAPVIVSPLSALQPPVMLRDQKASPTPSDQDNDRKQTTEKVQDDGDDGNQSMLTPFIEMASSVIGAATDEASLENALANMEDENVSENGSENDDDGEVFQAQLVTSAATVPVAPSQPKMTSQTAARTPVDAQLDDNALAVATAPFSEQLTTAATDMMTSLTSSFMTMQLYPSPPDEDEGQVSQPPPPPASSSSSSYPHVSKNVDDDMKHHKGEFVAEIDDLGCYIAPSAGSVIRDDEEDQKTLIRKNMLSELQKVGTRKSSVKIPPTHSSVISVDSESSTTMQSQSNSHLTIARPNFMNELKGSGASKLRKTTTPAEQPKPIDRNGAGGLMNELKLAAGGSQLRKTPTTTTEPNPKASQRAFMDELKLAAGGSQLRKTPTTTTEPKPKASQGAFMDELKLAAGGSQLRKTPMPVPRAAPEPGGLLKDLQLGGSKLRKTPTPVKAPQKTGGGMAAALAMALEQRRAYITDSKITVHGSEDESDSDGEWSSDEDD